MADAYGNAVGPSDQPGYASVESAAFDALPKEWLKLFTDVRKIVKEIVDDVNTSTQKIQSARGIVDQNTPGSGRLGLGAITKGQALSGLGLGVVATGALGMSMAPGTMSAVTQAMGASTYAGFAGMTNMQATRLANSQVGMGATSAMGPTMAAMTLSNLGYTANSMSSQNVMSQLAGLSAMTGMSNEQVAGAVAGVNGMNFLRLGIRVRDSKGNLLPPNQIVNSVYNALIRGKITSQQAATAFLNPGGKGYQVLQQVSGGNAALMQTLQSGMMARAQIGSDITAAQMGNAKTMLGAMNVDKSSPMYSNFANNTAQANALAATESGLVGGYNTALNTNAALTNDFASVANAASGVTRALMGLKGMLETFPNAGGVGGTLTRGAGAIGGAAMNAYAMKKILGGMGTAATVAEDVGTVAKDAGLLAKIGGVALKALPLLAFLGGPEDHGDGGHGSSIGQGGPTSGTLPVPKSTPITSKYGPRGGGAKTKGFHAGIDFGAQTGTRVFAHAAGTVTIVGNGGGYGKYVEVDHGTYRTRYAHLKSISVSRGQKVSGGDIIGISGATGNVTGPHLHFEVLVNGKKVNPTPYLSNSTNAAPKAVNSSLGSLSSQDINSIIASLGPTGTNNADNMFGEAAAKNLNNGTAYSFFKGKFQTTKGTILGTGSQQAWAKTLLQKLGKPTTSSNIAALTTWAAWEGGQWHNSAHYNPLNTEQGAPGATNMNPEGVKSYVSWDQGYKATIATLNNGRYKNILAALSRGNNTGAVLSAVDHSPWGTHIPGYGGPGAELGTAGVSVKYSNGHGGPASVSSPMVGSNVVINLNMKVQIAQSSVAEAKRLVNIVGQELKNSAVLKSIGGSI
jgi:murein DD-endopeptidase MepM/ murein hydrolase activator NlpD